MAKRIGKVSSILSLTHLKLTSIQELAELTSKPPPLMKINLPNESDLHKWHIILSGPPSSPFEGGSFTLLLTLPKDYPFKPPLLSFQTKIYHPNVSNDDKGAMCLGILKPDEWKPAIKIVDVLEFMAQVIREPNLDDAVEQSIAHEMREDRKAWEKKAKEWTRKYASGKDGTSENAT
ncbi:MAG: hypothetical protein GOMPHAMPRED_002303 [Gomphillus americanus]|uniref:E2 ubiquitin-conjugating enzyme n=1 Tax=Gomphillus americanus TaxID=1940652 RepID=A0A8H3FA21_9LECA|nr:MAG: hypothetical protein GOMPHAMPRED_002303 [Gomphillus americanus]